MAPACSPRLQDVTNRLKYSIYKQINLASLSHFPSDCRKFNTMYEILYLLERFQNVQSQNNAFEGYNEENWNGTNLISARF